MIDNIPDGWRVEKWDNILEIKNGKNQKAVASDDGAYPIYGSGGVMGYANDYLCKENSVIIGRKGSINNPLFVKEKFWNVDTAFGLISNEDVLLPLYLYYFSLTFDFERLNTTTTIPSLTKERLKNIQIPLPPLPQQEKIVKVLESSLQLIEKQKELIEEYNLFLKSKFIEMFGDPIKNPMGWEVEKLDKFTTLVSSGSTPKGGQSSYLVEGEIRFIRSQNVRMNKMAYNGIYYISEEVYIKMKRSQLKFNDVLLNITGASIGRTAIYKDTTRANVNQHVCIIRLTEELNNEYLSFMISTDSFQNQIISNQSGATREALNYTQIKKFNIPYPPINLQNKFASIVEKVETIKKQETQKLKHLETLHNSLMDKAFKGEIV